MTRIYRVFPLEQPLLVYVASTDSLAPERKILSNLVHSFHRVPKRVEKRVRMHDVVKTYPSVFDWGIEEERHTTFEELVQDVRKQAKFTLLNDGEHAVVTPKQGGYVIVRLSVKDCPEFFCLRVTSAGKDPIYDMFRRFRTLNAMQATRGQIRVEFPEALLKALSKWYDEGCWTCTVLEGTATMTDAYLRLAELAKELSPPLDGPLHAENAQPRATCLLRWLRDLTVPELADLHLADRQYRSPPRPIPTPGFIAVLVTRHSGKERIFSVHSQEERDEEHLLRMIQSATPKTVSPEEWQETFYVTPPVYCSDVNSARLRAAVTPRLAGQWDKFCTAVKGTTRHSAAPVQG